MSSVLMAPPKVAPELIQTDGVSARWKPCNEGRSGLIKPRRSVNKGRIADMAPRACCKLLDSIDRPFRHDLPGYSLGSATAIEYGHILGRPHETSRHLHHHDFICGPYARVSAARSVRR